MPRGPNRRISSWAEESSLRYLGAKTRIDLHVAICIRWEREIIVIIEGRSNATNVMSSRGGVMKTRHHRQLSAAEEKMKWHSSTWHVPDSEERRKAWTEYRRLIQQLS